MATTISKLMQSTYLPLGLRVILALVFINASLDKIDAPAVFAIAVENYHLVPSFLSNTIAIILPWLEFWCGISLLTGIWQRGGAMLIAFMSCIFIFALISAMVRGLEIDCGCFGAGSRIDIFRIAEDIIFLLLAVYLLRYPSDKFTLNRYIAGYLSKR